MTPKIWQKCGTCKGTGCIKWSEMGQQYKTTCKACEASPLPGYRAILYTPEQWEEAGGVLHDELPMYELSLSGHWRLLKRCQCFVDSRQIVATSAITMKDLEEI